MIENAVEKHKEKCILPQPQDCLPGRSNLGDKQYKRATGNGGKWKEQEMAVRGKHDHHTVIDVERPLV